MSTYHPTRWVILAITNPSGEVLHKVFATWLGSYTTGESWKLNSGNESVRKDIYWYCVHGFSGSVYELHKDAYGISFYTAGVLADFLKEECVKLLSEEQSLEYLENACE